MIGGKKDKGFHGSVNSGHLFARRWPLEVFRIAYNVQVGKEIEWTTIKNEVSPVARLQD